MSKIKMVVLSKGNSVYNIKEVDKLKAEVEKYEEIETDLNLTISFLEEGIKQWKAELEEYKKALADNPIQADMDALNFTIGLLEAEAEEAKKDTARHKRQGLSHSQSYQETIKDLKLDLLEFGRHAEGCNYPHGEGYGCKCGWLETEKKLKGGEK